MVLKIPNFLLYLYIYIYTQGKYINSMLVISGTILQEGSYKNLICTVICIWYQLYLHSACMHVTVWLIKMSQEYLHKYATTDRRL